jgi:hypothetical protein
MENNKITSHDLKKYIERQLSNNTPMIYSYSFELKPEKCQRSGYENRSRIDEPFLNLSLDANLKVDCSKHRYSLPNLTMEELQNPLIRADTDGIERLVYDMKFKFKID